MGIFKIKYYSVLGLQVLFEYWLNVKSNNNININIIINILQSDQTFFLNYHTTEALKFSQKWLISVLRSYLNK
jgi:hypothetical protein